MLCDDSPVSESQNNRILSESLEIFCEISLLCMEQSSSLSNEKSVTQ